MEKFLLTATILATTAWGIFVYIVFNTLPHSTTWVLTFLGVFFIASELTFGTVVYLSRTIKKSEFKTHRQLFRESLFLILPLDLGIVIFFVLRYFALANIATITLLGGATILGTALIVHKL